MAFGVISTLYFPIAASAGTSQWGTDVRKLLSAADATNDVGTTMNHGTGGVVTRTADPYSTSAADLDQTLYGWAINPTDMGSTADFVRSYPAGNHVLTARMSQSGVAEVVVTVTVYVYRVGNAAGGRVRTLLGSGSATPTIAALGIVTTVNVTVALGAVTFGPDETIQYALETTVTGVAITGRTVNFQCGTEGGVAVRMDTPPLEIIAGTTGTASGIASTAGVLSAQADMAGTAAGTSTVAGALAVLIGITGTASASSSAAGVLGATAGMTGGAGGSSTATGSLGATAGLVGSSASFASVAGVLTAVADMIGSAFGTSTALGVPSSLAGTIGTADGTSDAFGILGAILATVGTATVGAACPQDWPINDGLKAIEGDVFFHEPPNEGDPVVGALVSLIRDEDGLLIVTTVTDGAGHYSFPRDSNDPYTYHVEVRYLDQQGLSKGGCIPA